MSDHPSGLPPEEIEKIAAHLEAEDRAERDAALLSWDAFRVWLSRQTELLRANPGLLESIVQIGPALLAQLARLIS